MRLKKSEQEQDSEDENEDDYKYLTDHDYYKPLKKPNFPVRWTAPESIKNYHFSTKSDVWSFGIFMFEVATKGKLPYSDLDNHEVKEQVVNYEIELPNLNVSCFKRDRFRFLKELELAMKACLEFEVKDRAYFSGILPFFEYICERI